MTSQSFDPHSSIPYIPQDRMAVAAEMLANLVHSSRDGIDGNNGIVLPLEDPSVRGQGLLPFKRDVHLTFFRNLSFDNGKIDLSQTLFADEPSEDSGRCRALCQDDCAGSAAVQPVCRPQFARGPSLDQVILAKCYEIRIRFFGSLVYRSSRIFVHDGDHVIFEQQVDLWPGFAQKPGTSDALFQCDSVIKAQQRRRGGGRTVKEKMPALYQLLHVAARCIWHQVVQEAFHLPAVVGKGCGEGEHRLLQE